MKAILYTKYGPPDVLELHEIEKPVPKDNEVLVRVHASSVNAFEWRRFTMPKLLVRMMGGGLWEPKEKAIGADLAGHVESVGSAVTQFRPGDAVFGLSKGAYAEYVCAAEDRLLVPKPANVSFQAAASVPLAALTALQAVRDHGKVQAGQQVLIHGAGGGVGVFAVQIAKAFGATVTAVCGAQNVDMVWSLGADDVLDYKKEDFTQTGQQYDLIVGVNGYRSIFDYRRALKPDGIYVLVGGFAAQLLQGLILGPLLSRIGNKKFTGMMTRPKRDDLVLLKDLLESGKIAPVIDSCYSLDKVPDAVRFLMKEHARGKVVITI